MRRLGWRFPHYVSQNRAYTHTLHAYFYFYTHIHVCETNHTLYVCAYGRDTYTDTREQTTDTNTSETGGRRSYFFFLFFSFLYFLGFCVLGCGCGQQAARGVFSIGLPRLFRISLFFVLSSFFFLFSCLLVSVGFL